MINPSQSHTTPLAINLNLPKSSSPSSVATPRLSGFPSLSNTPINKDFPHALSSPSQIKRNLQTSHSNTPRSSTRDTTCSKNPLEPIHNEHFSQSHKEASSPLNKIRIKTSVPKLNLKGHITGQSVQCHTTESPRSPTKLTSLKDKMESYSARSLKGSYFLKERSESNPNPQDIALARLPSAQAYKEDESQKMLLNPQVLGEIKEQQSLDGIKLSRNNSRLGTKINLKVKVPVPLKKLESKKNGHSIDKSDKLALKWLPSDLAELASICLPPSATGTSMNKGDKSVYFDRAMPKSARSHYQECMSPVSPQLSDRSSLFSRNLQRDKTEEKEEENLPYNLDMRSNSLPYHLPRKVSNHYFCFDTDNMSPTLQDDTATRSYSPAEHQTLDDEYVQRRDRKSVTAINKSDSPYESGSQSYRASASPIPKLNLAKTRMIKQGEVVNPSSFRKTSFFQVEKKYSAEEADDVDVLEDNKGVEYDIDHHYHNSQNRNIFNNTEFGFFEVNTDNVFIKEYIEGTGPNSTISKGFLKQLKGKSTRDDQAPLVVSSTDQHETIIIQPKFMQQYGSMSFTELWSGQRKKDFVHAKKKEVQVRKVDTSEATDTIFRPDKKRGKLLIQKRITANRGDYSIRSSALQDQIKSAASRIVRKQTEAIYHQNEAESESGEPMKIRGVIDPNQEDVEGNLSLRRRVSKKSSMFVPIE